MSQSRPSNNNPLPNAESFFFSASVRSCLVSAQSDRRDTVNSAPRAPEAQNRPRMLRCRRMYGVGSERECASSGSRSISRADTVRRRPSAEHGHLRSRRQAPITPLVSEWRGLLNFIMHDSAFCYFFFGVSAGGRRRSTDLPYCWLRRTP
ncbi:hypothetical protein FA95DRAFT_671718 [Auriscalpium vulgare]|uniref:Uncharacterized protein n=1 Tax=Auriscalpium vulgare TaxID=40419 RepID=A0ACB8RDE5_9AGAM|nr:hypothetical protein FA95DRAFT_671718 [Auriscalpium vulgare]